MRLTHAAIRPAAEAVGITFDGRPISALPGETLAAALTAAGELVLRRTSSGAPRGLHCGMGACFDCLVTIDGRPNQRACLAKVSAGMAVASAVPARPAPLAAAPAGQAAEVACDLLVVGAGPAGLSAAIAAAEAGCDVVVLDERDAPGGQYLKPLAASHAHAAPDRQFRQGAALRQRALAAGVRCHFGATVWGGFAADEIAALVDGANTVFRPRRLVVAAGSHERPVPIPGWTLPGVMTTGCLQTLARANRVSPGRVVIAGNGPLNLQLACELVEGGVQVAAVLEAAPNPGLAGLRQALRLAAAAPDLAWDGARYLAVLRRAGVRVMWGARPLAAEGEGRFATLLAATPRGTIRIEADALALNLGFQPETGLARALGCAHRFVDSGLGRLETVTDADGRTSLPTVFAVGDGAQVGGARIALARGRLAGLAAARDLRPELPEDAATRQALSRAEKFQEALWRFFAVPEFDAAGIADTTLVCRCEEVSAGALRAAVQAGAGSLGAAKKATRAGMGRCQGRMCGATVARIAGASEEAGWAAPRAPLKPVPALALAMERPEWAEGPAADPGPAVPAPRRPATGAAESCDVLVVGGGALGLSAALYCAREGLSVILAERGEPGQGATTANAGSLHVQLHAYDSAGAEAGPESAAAQMLAIGPASIALWREIAAEAGEGLGIRTEGGIMLAETPEQMRRLSAKTAMEREFGVDSRMLGPNELYALAPYLARGFAGAAFCAAEGQMDPLRGLSALLGSARRAGASVRGGTAIAAIARDGSGFRAETSAGAVLRAGQVVNAAGPWAGEIGRMLGAPIPVRAAVQQVMVTEAAGAEVMRHLVLHAGRHLSAKQGEAGHLVLGGAWPGALDAQGRPRNLRASIEGNLFVAGTVLPALAGLHLIRAWAGLNVQVPGPILGADPRVPGLHHAVTFNGWTLGPVAGRLVAEGVGGRTGAAAAFGPGRF